MAVNKRRKGYSVQKIVITGLFVAMGVILPRFFPYPLGMSFLPMHLPILLAGIICGLPYGLLCGIIVPVISHFAFAMPQPPMLYAMICELAAYGLFTSLLMMLPLKSLYTRLCISLYGAMLLGRIVYGAVNAFFFQIGDYSMQGWIAAAFVTSLPGIVIQIVLIPPIAIAANKAFRDIC